jgi:hypothetical protein
LEVGRLSSDAYRRAIAALNAEAAKLDRTDRNIATLQIEMVPDPEAGDPGEINAHLRRLWSAVAIGPDKAVVDVEWIVPEFMDNKVAYAEWEAAADKR